MKQLRPLILFWIGGLLYVLIELTVRGRTHWSMFIVGGLAFFLIGFINEKCKKMPLAKQMLIGALVITTLEFTCGCIVNLWLGWHVWDYSNMPFNLLGQICLPFTAIWFFYQLSQLCLMIIFDTSCGARRFHITNYFRLEVD